MAFLLLMPNPSIFFTILVLLEPFHKAFYRLVAKTLKATDILSRQTLNSNNPPTSELNEYPWTSQITSYF